MSLLTIVQQALQEIGLQAPGNPTQVFGNADLNIGKALALTNRAALELRDATNAADYWSVLRKQFLFNLAGQGPFTGTFVAGSNQITNVTYQGSGTGISAVQPGWQVSSKFCLPDTAVVSVTGGGPFTVTMNQGANTVAGGQSGTDSALAFGQEAYPLPPTPGDFNYFIPGTGWDRNFRWQLLGPVNAQEWQVLKSGISPVGPRIRYRLMAGSIYLQPSPFIQTGNISPVTDLIVMEYASNFWCGPAGATTTSQALFQADTDIALAFPEDLLTLSLKWRMLKALGSAYADELEEYNRARDRRTGRETMARALPLNARAGQLRLLNSQQVPDTGFGS